MLLNSYIFFNCTPLLTCHLTSISLCFYTDCSGYRTVIMARLAEIYYNTPGIALKVLGPPRNGQQIHTEARLELQLASNDIDVGFFYDCEQSWSNTGNLRFIPLPVEINMSNRTLNPYYAKVNLDFFIIMYACIFHIL